MNSSDYYDEDLKLSDAYRWLFKELGHIRRLHFTLTLFSVLTITVILLSQSKTGEGYKELEGFQSLFTHGVTDDVFRSIFLKRIRTFAPDGLPDNPVWFRNRIERKLVIPASVPINVTPNTTLLEVRIALEKIGVTVTLISRVDLPEDAVGEYYEWRQDAFERGYEAGDHVATVKWPTGGVAGHIEYVAEAGSRIQLQSPEIEMERKRFGLHSFLQGPLQVETRFSTTATFEISSEVWKVPQDWLERTFPFLTKNWEDYAGLPTKEALRKAKQRFIGEFFEINLPLGVKIPKEASIFGLPLILVSMSILLLVEVLHVSSFAAFCQKRWPHKNPCFLSPWMAGRKWVLIRPLILMSYLLVSVTIGWLFYSFPVFGVKISYIIAIISVFFMAALMYYVSKAAQSIISLSFPVNHYKQSIKSLESDGQK
jgi:hypothetical protein